MAKKNFLGWLIMLVTLVSFIGCDDHTYLGDEEKSSTGTTPVTGTYVKEAYLKEASIITVDTVDSENGRTLTHKGSGIWNLECYNKADNSPATSRDSAFTFTGTSTLSWTPKRTVFMEEFRLSLIGIDTTNLANGKDFVIKYQNAKNQAVSFTVKARDEFQKTATAYEKTVELPTIRIQSLRAPENEIYYKELAQEVVDGKKVDCQDVKIPMYATYTNGNVQKFICELQIDKAAYVPPVDPDVPDTPDPVPPVDPDPVPPVDPDPVPPVDPDPDPVPPVENTYDTGWDIKSIVPGFDHLDMVITITNNKGAQRDSTVSTDVRNKFWFGESFSVNMENNSVDFRNIDTRTENTGNTRRNGGFTLTKVSCEDVSNFNGFSHPIFREYETIKFTHLGTTKEVSNAVLKVAYVDFSQSESVNGDVTTYKTNLNYKFTYNGNSQSGSQLMFINVKKSTPNPDPDPTPDPDPVPPVDPTPDPIPSPDIIVPDALGRIIGVDKTIALVGGAVSNRVNVLNIKCENGIYSLIGSQWYTWVGANTNGTTSATSFNTDWTAATLNMVKEGLWLYNQGGVGECAFDIPSANIQGVTTPILPVSAEKLSDTVWRIDGVVYGTN